MKTCTWCSLAISTGAMIVPAFAWAADPAAREWLVFSPSAFASIEERVAVERDSVGLTERQAIALGERHAALLEVRTHETAADYLALMQSWGGVFRLDPTTKEFTEAQVVDWHAPGSPCAWASLNLDSIEIIRVEGFDGGVPFTAGWSRPPRGSNGVIALGSFTFAGGTENLVKGGAPVVQITSNVETTDGSRMSFGIRWVWDAASEAWVPWHVHQFGESGEGACVLFY